MTILLVTHSQDNESVALVNQAIAAQGGHAVRFDTDFFPTDTRLSLFQDNSGHHFILTTPQTTLDCQDITAIWYRRIGTGLRIPETMDDQLRMASIQESRETVQGFITSLNAFHLDPVHRIRRASHKQRQLQLASQLGLQIPRSLVTNDPAAVKQFAQQCPHGLVTKMQASFAVYENGKEKVVFTNPVSDEDLENLDGLKYCPMTFQEQIPKALELRITIVGQNVFTAAVDSQKLDQAQYDWRRKGIDLVNDWYPYTIPVDLEVSLLKLMAVLELNYGAIDVILTPDGRYIFLEINPVGEFFWIDRVLDASISKAIATLLQHPPTD